MRGIRLLGILIVLVLTAAACGGGSSQTEMEQQLQNGLTDELTPAEVRAVTCPEDADLTPESVFRCEATVEGSYYVVQVTIIDAQGRFEYERRHAVLNVVKLEAELGADATTALGFEVGTNCGDNEYLVVSIDNTFQCTLTRTANDAQRNIEVQVENANGGISWTLLSS